MDRIIRGAAKFNQSGDPELKAKLAHLSHAGQQPTALLITCVDSRVMPSLVTEAEPGQILTLRNIGNIVPDPVDSWVGGDTSVASTVSFSLEALDVPNIIVMGHSECGGMMELFNRRNDFRSDAIGTWLRNGRNSLQRMNTGQLAEDGLTDVNRLSQLNVLHSLEVLSHFPEVRNRLDKMTLTLHGWWFDLASATVFAFEPRAGRFVPVERAYESAVSTPSPSINGY